MPLLGNSDSSEYFADSTAITTVSSAAAIVLDDSWLEAILHNLALAHLPRREYVELLGRLEHLERELDRLQPPLGSGSAPRYQIAVGDHFDGPFNAYAMRAPEAMTPQNVIETIELAARRFLADRHAAALKQLVFFISGSLEEVIAEDGLEED